MIACMDRVRGIGYKDRLLTHLPADLQHFRKLTTNTITIMGRRTYESILAVNFGQPLSNRITIVLTHDTNYKADHPEVFVYNSIEDILHEYYSYGEGKSEVFICGGAEIYKQFLPYADKLYITEINHTFQSDTYFPEINPSQWELSRYEPHVADDKNPYDYSFKEYIKIK